jgi:hypothetical protein
VDSALGGSKDSLSEKLRLSNEKTHKSNDEGNYTNITIIIHGPLGNYQTHLIPKERDITHACWSKYHSTQHPESRRAQSNVTDNPKIHVGFHVRLRAEAERRIRWEQTNNPSRETPAYLPPMHVPLNSPRLVYHSRSTMLVNTIVDV